MCFETKKNTLPLDHSMCFHHPIQGWTKEGENTQVVANNEFDIDG